MFSYRADICIWEDTAEGPYPVEEEYVVMLFIANSCKEFFDAEVVHKLCALRMLEEPSILEQVPIRITGIIGEKYLAHQLLDRRRTLTPVLESFRDIATNIAHSKEDNQLDLKLDSEALYERYIRDIVHLLIRHTKWGE